MTASPTPASDPDAVLVEDLSAWLTLAVDRAGHEHIVLSDGRHHIRLDVEEGHLSGEIAVRLRYRLEGVASARTLMPPLQRFLELCRQHRFPHTLFPRDPRIARGIEVLRVHDALAQGASQRDIGEVLFGERRIAEQWAGPSDSLRSRLRRLVREARAMAAGGYRSLLRRGSDEPRHDR